MVELAFSILASDFAHLADEVKAAERGGGSIVHVDVMDGHFVPNITFGPPMVEALRPVTNLPIDCHLMIENPDNLHPCVRRGRRRPAERPPGGLPPSAPHSAAHLRSRHAARGGHQPGNSGGHPDRSAPDGALCAGHERQSVALAGKSSSPLRWKRSPILQLCARRWA